jgi:hypothetical protein
VKVAIYIEDGTTQIVLTPETKFEKATLEHMHSPGHSLSVFRGSFYACQGGWYRNGTNDDSTMLRIDRIEEAPNSKGDGTP